MAKTSQITLNLNVTKNGATCESPVITIFNSDIVGMPCGNLVDSNGDLKLSLPIDLFGQDSCISGFVQCEDCDNCGELDFTICLCEDADDCQDCEDCVDGVCVSLCTDSQYCVDDTCVDCRDANDCPTGYQCLNGKCVCPSGYLNELGECIDCLTAADCDPCEECVGGSCVPRECPAGQVCDPSQDACVDCLIASDCGPNETCVDNQCECLPGYIRDENGDCVPEPPCTKDADCGPCGVCIDGECEPVVCPEGHVCDPLTGNCVYNPCPDVPCTDGTDCPDGCGCDQTTGECVPCKDKSCATEECSNILGCECNNGVCEDADDGCNSAPCVNFNDCGEGCTCFEGECVSCDNFDCTTSDCDQRVGCECVRGKCVGADEDCNDTFTLEKDDDNCSLTATLGTVNACPCSKIAVETTFVEMVTTLQGVPASTSYYLRFLTELKKGNQFGPRLDDISDQSIAHNETATSGSAKFNLVFKVEDKATKNITFSTPQTFSGSLAGRGFTQVDVKFGEAAGATVTLEELVGYNPNTETILEIQVTVSTSELEFPNGCDYNAEELYTFSFETIANELGFGSRIDNEFEEYEGDDDFKLISSDDERSPLFVWYKSADATFAPEDVFRKIYVSADSPATYIDELLGPGEIDPETKENLTGTEGELWANRYYQVTNDCGCVNLAQLDNKLVFCNPKIEDFEYSLTNCGTIITLDSPFTPCPVNGDLTDFQNLPDYAIPNDVQVTYSILLNDVEVHTFTGTLNTWTHTVDVGDVITSIKIKQSIDDEEICTIDITDDSVSVPDPTYDIVCSGETYTATFQPAAGGTTIQTIYHVNTNTSIPGLSVSGLERGIDNVFNISFANGCVKTITINKDCCDAFAITATPSFEECEAGGDATITVVHNNGVAPFVYDITADNGYSRLGITTGSPITIPNYDAGIYTIVATDATGCSKQDTFGLLSTDALDLTLTSPDSACFNTTVNINVSSNQPTATVQYTVNGGPNQSINLAAGQGTITFNIGTTNAVVEVVSVNQTGGCLFDNLVGDYTQNITVVSEPTAALTGVPTSACTGVAIPITITGGTSGAQVNISASSHITGIPTAGCTNYSPSSGCVILDAAGNASFTIVPTSAVSSFIQIDSVVLGDCTGGAGTTHNFGVTLSPPIYSFEGVCDPAVLGDVDVTVQSVTGATVDILSPFTATNAFTETPAGSGNYTYDYAGGSGAVMKVRVNKGGCSTESDNVQMEICTCQDMTLSMTADGLATTNVGGCEGSTVNLIGNVDAGGTPSYTYTWNIGGVNYLGQSINPVVSNAQGTLTVTDAAGCSNTLDFTVTSYPTPQIVSVFQVDDGECVGGLYTYSAWIDPGAAPGVTLTYNWSVTDGSATLSYPNGQFGSSFGVIYSEDGIFDVSVTVDRTLNGVTCSSAVGTYQETVGVPTTLSAAGDYKDVTYCHQFCNGIFENHRSYGTLGTYFHDVPATLPLNYTDSASFPTEGQGVKGFATGTLTFTGQPSDTETVTINAKTYTFQAALTNVDGNVAIGATAADSVANLIAAINLGSGGGTAYAALTTLHPDVSAATGDTSLKMVATANELTDNWAPNAYATTLGGAASGNLAWGGATLSGGWGGADQAPWDYDEGLPSAAQKTRLNKTGIETNNGYGEIVMTFTYVGANALAIGFGTDNEGEMWINGTKIIQLEESAAVAQNRPFRNWWVIETGATAGDCIHIRANNVAAQTPFALGFEFYSVDVSTLKGDTSASPWGANPDQDIDAYVVFDGRDVIANPATYSLTGYVCEEGGSPQTIIPGNCTDVECQCP